MTYAAVIDVPIPGIKLGIHHGCEGICRIDFLSRGTPALAARSPLAEQAVEELQAYFDDPRRRFTVTLEYTASPFQRRVWDTLTLLPPGETVTYGRLAQRLRTGARAVGAACRANPIPVIVPCHRVVSGTGLGGYSGRVDGRHMEIKQWLLQHER